MCNWPRAVEERFDESGGGMGQSRNQTLSGHGNWSIGLNQRGKSMRSSLIKHKRGETRRRNPGILIADDMALILTLLKFELDSRGFSTWLAVDGDDALDLYRKHCDEIDLVLLDVQMPGLDGPHTLKALQQLNPHVLACFMLGSADNYSEPELRGRGAAWIFSKPFRPNEVADVVVRVVSASRTQRPHSPVNRAAHELRASKP
jgi:CheY-like chemotaxis protein